MKTKYWILLLALTALLLAGICVWQMTRSGAGFAEVYSDGVLVKTVDLSVDQEFTVECAEGFNRIVVQNGKIAVAQADCRGNDCVKSGARSGGSPIVCLPHRLVIQFTGASELDGLVQ